jgi:PIN domain nuclease of toxin-antitoxin system
LIWWVLGDATLSAPARQFIVDPANQIFVSAASAWEISTKYRLGKLPNAAQLARQFPQTVFGQGFIPLPVTIQHAIMSGAFTAAHPDPFDRMLAAQSIIEHMPIMSIDSKLDLFGVNRIW